MHPLHSFFSVLYLVLKPPLSESDLYFSCIKQERSEVMFLESTVTDVCKLRRSNERSGQLMADLKCETSLVG